MNKFLNFLGQTFLLLPLAVLQSAAIGLIILFLIQEPIDNFYDVLGIVLVDGLLLGVEFFLCWLVRLIRSTSESLIIAVLISPFKVVFQLISCIIAFIALFADIDSDFTDGDGVIGYLFNINTYNDFSLGESFNSKFSNFLGSLLLYVPLSAIQSFWGFNSVYYFISGKNLFLELGILIFGGDGSLGLLLVIIIYFFLFVFSIQIMLMLKGSDDMGLKAFYSTFIVRDRYGREHVAFKDYFETGTLFAVVCAVLSPILVITSTIGAILALFLPPADEYASVCSSFKIFEFDDMPFLARLLYYFTGIVLY